MNELKETKIGCPYCGETISVLIDPSDTDNSYIEDCQVCCRPINFNISLDYDNDLVIHVTSDDD